MILPLASLEILSKQGLYFLKQTYEQDAILTDAFPFLAQCVVRVWRCSFSLSVCPEVLEAC